MWYKARVEISHCWANAQSNDDDDDLVLLRWTAVVAPRASAQSNDKHNNAKVHEFRQPVRL